METSNQNPNPTNFKEVYSQFYESVNSMADGWFRLTEIEKTDFVKVNQILNIDNVIANIDDACNTARELPKEVAHLDEAKGIIAMFMIRDAMLLLNYKDKFGFQLKDYLSIMHEL